MTKRILTNPAVGLGGGNPERAPLLEARKTFSRVRRFVQAPRIAELGLRACAAANRMLNSRGEYILLACMPKSGSTFVKKALMNLTGFPEEFLSYAFERTEQELYLPRVIDSYSRGTVTQQHVRATEANLRIMNRYGIRPVILVRNLYDVVVSIRDYLFAEGFEKFPSLYATAYLGEMDEDEQYEFLITYALPWYFAFYVSWHDACAAGRIDALWLSYEDLSQDWPAGITRILDHYGIHKTDSEVKQALAQCLGEGAAAIRLNKGVVGRGSRRLTERHRRLIERMASFYPWVDFAPVGLRTGAQSKESTKHAPSS